MNATMDLVTGGGTAERTFQMSRFLARAGTQCDILILDLGLTPERMSALEGVRVFALPCINRRYYIPMFSLRRVRDVVAVTDVVHLMGHWTLINALVYLLARYLGKPYVVCPAEALPIYGRSRLLKRIYNLLIGERIVRHADGHVAIVGNEVPHFETYGVPAEEITIIPNGVSEEGSTVGDGTNFRARHGLGNHPLLLFVGRLNHIKGPDLLLQAFAEAGDDLRDHHLVFVGPDDGMLAGLKAATVGLGVEGRVHFVGYLGGADKTGAYQAADLLVIPSRQEAMSMVVLESGIVGTPVLITDQCGFDEVAEVDGGKVVPATVEGLREGLIELAKDRPRLKTMGNNLRKFVRSRFSWHSVVEKYLDLYERVLQTRR